jgi:hypothetical protein
MRAGSSSLFGVDDNGKARLHNEREKREPNRHYCVCVEKRETSGRGTADNPAIEQDMVVTRDTLRYSPSACLYRDQEAPRARTSKICGQEG